MLSRILEPELMDSPEEAVDYDTMDHSMVNRVFVDDFLEALRSSPGCRILDVGTGTAQIPLELCAREGNWHVTAIDAAGHMLQVALRNVLRAGRQQSVRLEQVDAKAMPYEDGAFDAVMSNSIVHHIPEPLAVFREMARVLKPGGLLFVRDLLRPSDLPALQRLVATYAGDANAHQRQMFGDSLHAALTVEEVADLLEKCGLPGTRVRATSDRHWTVSGCK